MRVGIFGGTFDPVHQGHLILAEQCREQGQLDEVWFMPTANPPHKQQGSITRFDQRVEMLNLALAGNPAFRVEPIEKEREGPNYTADTLEELKRRHPDVEIFLLLGSDSLNDMPNWYQPQRILEQASLMVMRRADTPVLSDEEIQRQLGHEVTLTGIEAPPLIDIASRDLRRRVSEGRSIRYLVPRSVECFIQEKKLYQQSGAGF